MHQDSLQLLRYKLQTRYRRVNGSDYRNFVVYLIHFFEFLDATPITKSVIDLLTKKYLDLQNQINELLNKKTNLLHGENLEEHAAIAFAVLQRWAKPDEAWKHESLTIIMEVSHNDRLAHIKSLFLEPLYEYIDESLDDSRAVLAQLIRYKHRTEWYRRGELHTLYVNETGKGERHLADDLYLYLHDQGIDFIVEPHTVSGIPDLLVQASELNRIVADAKIFDPEKSKGLEYLAKGFHQVYIYLNDYNEPFGYMVIFNASSKNLTFDVSGVDAQIPYVTLNGKTIFLHVIDIFLHQTSASKRGKLETLILKELQLIQAVEEAAEGDVDDE